METTPPGELRDTIKAIQSCVVFIWTNRNSCGGVASIMVGYGQELEYETRASVYVCVEVLKAGENTDRDIKHRSKLEDEAEMRRVGLDDVAWNGATLFCPTYPTPLHAQEFDSSSLPCPAMLASIPPDELRDEINVIQVRPLLISTNRISAGSVVLITSGYGHEQEYDIRVHTYSFRSAAPPPRPLTQSSP